MQDFGELTEWLIGAAVEFLCALGVLGGKKLVNTRNIKTCALGQIAWRLADNVAIGSRADKLM